MAVFADVSSELDRLYAVAEITGAEIVRCNKIDELMEIVRREDETWLPILSVTTVSDKSWAEIRDLSQYARMHDRSGLVVTSVNGLDLLFGLIETSPLNLLVDPDDMALAVGILQGNRTLSGRHVRENDRTDPHALHQLSEQMQDLARAMAHLADAPTHAGIRELSKGRSEARPLDARVLREEIRRRRARDQYFEPALFADPAWDMLLDLMAARLEGRQVSVSSLCIAAAVPPTTALRWIKTMTDMGMLVRQADPEDARRVFIALSDDAAAGMRRYFTEIG